MQLRDSSGAALTLSRKLGEGGEGVVYSTSEPRGIVAKLYAQPLSRVQVAKLETMVHAGDETLLSVAAWPLALVFEGVRPVGFTMPLLGSQHALHELIGPKRRQTLFPDAHWNFLIHTGINLARSFEILHARGIVVGDVNSSNVVVNRDATTRLIDCDSFQIRAQNAVFRCNVGVAEYQPPELQGKDLARIDRLPQHDLFGLAVVIFQLLFVGKHPFSGVLPAHARIENATIGDNVAARRFFYGPEARRNGLNPPPGSLGLTAVTPEMALLFRRAFLGEPALRPGAAEWHRALDDLKERVAPCAASKAHRHLRGSACPWCALEKRGLHYFSLPLPPGTQAAAGETIWRNFGDAEIDRLWAEIARVAAPPARSPALPPAHPYRPTRLGLWTASRVWASVAAAAALIALVTALCLSRQFEWATLGAPLAVGLGLWLRPDARAVYKQRRRRLEETRKAFRSAEKDWNRAARNARFIETRDGLARVRASLKDQRRRFDADLAQLRAKRDAEELRRYLRGYELTVSRLPEIGQRTQLLLRSFGIVNAADIETVALRRVPHLTRRQRANLVYWRESLERSFRLLPKRALTGKAVRDLEVRHRRERMRDQAQLAGGAALLRQIATDTQRQRPALERVARERADLFRQAEADLRVSPLLYRTPIFS
jgi:DNA-binding helix-hairpin-helix protein with protein kinase domain